MMSFGQSPWSKGCVHEFIVHVKPVHLPKPQNGIIDGSYWELFNTYTLSSRGSGRYFGELLIVWNFW